MKKLYIIGNGFDLHHRIKSRYSDFREFMEQNDSNTYELVEKYLNHEGELWQDFESNLAYFDEETTIEKAWQYLTPYGSDDWSAADNHTYQNIIAEIINPLIEGLKSNFIDWVCQIQLPTVNPRLDLAPTNYYLTFNYTNTLEKLYNIPSDRILHIHGDANSDIPEIIFGHDFVKPADGPDLEKLKTDLGEERFQEYMEEDFDSGDPRVNEGESIVRRYYENTYKPCKAIIEQNKVFFDSLADVDEVFIMGHSLSDVDIPYLEAIKRSVSKSAVWNVSCYSDDERKRFPDKLRSIGIDGALPFELDPSAPKQQGLF